jgi:hypothetical protein
MAVAMLDDAPPAMQPSAASARSTPTSPNWTRWSRRCCWPAGWMPGHRELARAGRPAGLVAEEAARVGAERQALKAPPCRCAATNACCAGPAQPAGERPPLRRRRGQRPTGGCRAGGGVELQGVRPRPGRARAERERIFEAFFRLPGHAEREGGVGLGCRWCARSPSARRACAASRARAAAAASCSACRACQGPQHRSMNTVSAMLATTRPVVDAAQKPRAPSRACRCRAAEIEGQQVAAAQAHAPQRAGIDHHGHGGDAPGAQHESGHGLHRVGDVEQRHPGQQRQGGAGMAGLAVYRRTPSAGDENGGTPAPPERPPNARPCQPMRRASARSPAPMRCATKVLLALPSASGSMNSSDTRLVAI